MPNLEQLEDFLAGGSVDAPVFALRPDYRVMLVAVDGLVPGPGDQTSEALLQKAEQAATELLRDQAVDQIPHVAAWREAYRAFGAKPQRTRNSLEALLRRAASGLPRVNRLTDLYNAISVLHQIPLGGEEHLGRDLQALDRAERGVLVLDVAGHVRIHAVQRP